MATNQGYKLQKNGEDVTAQQAYDAFMNGVVLFELEGRGVSMPTAMVWRDSSGGQSDPSNVVGVRFDLNGTFFDIGNMPAD
jgi:hypothetical protein